MRRVSVFVLGIMVILGLASCSLPGSTDTNLQSTMVALGVQQTSIALEQTRGAETVVTEAPQAVQPTYTPYPTYTSQAAEVITEEVATEENVPALTFDDWMDEANILVYDDMYGLGDTTVIENAIEGLGLGRNVTNVGSNIGDFLSEMNSGMQWDLIVVASEARGQVQGEIFDVLAMEIDGGSSVVLETWYIDDIFNGRIQPVMQRCGITYDKDWQRDFDDNLNNYLVYLIEPSDPLFSEPNVVSMLIPYDVRWYGDVGDTVELISGSDAVLMAGRLPNEHGSYGLIAECLGGQMVWQTFSTHDYKDQDMINLWQNYIYNTLQARFDYLFD